MSLKEHSDLTAEKVKYVTKRKPGTAEHKPVFTCYVMIGDHSFPEAKQSRIKYAEEEAAKLAMAALQGKHVNKLTSHNFSSYPPWPISLNGNNCHTLFSNCAMMVKTFTLQIYVFIDVHALCILHLDRMAFGRMLLLVLYKVMYSSTTCREEQGVVVLFLKCLAKYSRKKV